MCSRTTNVAKNLRLEIKFIILGMILGSGLGGGVISLEVCISHSSVAYNIKNARKRGGKLLLNLNLSKSLVASTS